MLQIASAMHRKIAGDIAAAVTTTLLQERTSQIMHRCYDLRYLYISNNNIIRAHEGVHLLEELEKALLLLDQRLALVWCKIYVIAAQQAVCHLIEACAPDSATLVC